jgi:uncharacterized protein YbaR (Trm112 family)/2-polyprenyl-3-methyl-5-hydroxy-6-metoxy-1,4-benzoquinol methylase
VRDALFQILCCPRCRADLNVEAFEREGEDLLEGLLVCGSCARAYPLIDGIPHMLPNALAESPEFTKAHQAEIARVAEPPSAREVARFEKLHRRTASAFGYEWNRYKVTTPEEDLLTLCFLTGIDPNLYHPLAFPDVFTQTPGPSDVAKIDTSFFEGKRVLEVGCGMGKYVRTVAQHGGIAVGLDLSTSLDRARREHGAREDLHWVRGNILEHPFKEGVFDLVYSVGVLHHTPDCHQAFRNSASLVREDGHLAVWLYPTERMTTRYARLVHFVQDSLMRPITCRLPHSLLYRLCQVLGRMTFLRDEAARAGRTKWAQFYALFAVGAHPDPEIAAFLNFDWYSPQYRTYHSEDELLGWYREAGYDDVRILPQRTSAIGRRAKSLEPIEEMPAPLIRSNLESPTEGPLRREDSFLVGGWALEAAGRAPIVEIHLDDRLVATTRCFAARLDVKAAFPEFEHALYTGFHVTLRVPRRAKESLRLRVGFRVEGQSEPSVVIERDLKLEASNWRRRLVAPGIALLPDAWGRRLSRSPALRRLTGRLPLE